MNLYDIFKINKTNKYVYSLSNIAEIKLNYVKYTFYYNFVTSLIRYQLFLDTDYSI